MLDDMRVLRDAVREYRVTATAAGLDWPDQVESPVGQPPDVVYQVFGVDHIAEQLTWLQSQRWPDRHLLPNVGWRMPWPEGGDALDYLTLLRARQRECGVNMAIVEDGFEHTEELSDAIDAAKASLDA
ncbi:hypothetical protein [Micromonospora sp. NBC_01638]|uniref:hypothetical protein n=1 Tax=Micromonospora sp. NBC_01638 TaxID=2975982 RepID=UPI003870BF00|nr:hypothetical protein OG811_16005 [Micromonospora sp. NBC_01638]